MNTAAPLFDLSGRVAVVTGGASGLGLAAAQALGAAGAAVVLVSRRQAELQGAAQGLQAQGIRAACVAADLTQRQALGDLAGQVSQAFGAPDIAVHAAGVNRRQAADAVDSAAWDEQMELMLAAPFFLSRHLVDAMRRRGWGRVILFGSLQSQRAFADSLPYGAAKGGTVQLARAMAEAWSRDGVNANAIAPGFFPTALTRPVFDDPQRRAAIAQQTAVGRTGRPEDLHGAVVFLASRASDYVTGQTLYVDGGFTAK
ncbi:SDR family NAD(P)-dependent oxidoreductase [Ramlibacter tataouinensis]|uniref:Gluconate 5-dehydrogenase (5-keto-D-gluconate 5-reductase)-like protein n=1 Tax=Ramlibacter tataouinensis (strain ATCC BAA-407 / DSM 14655 / LMG 21543 / TTB310) TaxID=365046 RepID=F5Y4I5_RAMTT|nr:SDR family oxidoreductase [Ramlibacter tataouinensis]AEG93832.1 gluconate 5-dehydrogenase (5-keto-D-gluconate 5- reductase)-like protein [Ramlibacter tataouinensis TTB310]